MNWQKISHIASTKRARSAFVLIVLGAIMWFARDRMYFIGEGWRALKTADLKWILAGCVFVALSMVAQAEVMVIPLRSAGVNVKRRTANVLCMAANAWSSTFPGGPAMSVAMIFREQLKWGATPVIASWYMVLSGVLSGAGMAILAIGSIFFLGLKVQPFTLVLSLVTLAALAFFTNWIASNPSKVENWLISCARVFAGWRKKPKDYYTDNIRGFADQLSAIQLPLPQLAMAIAASLLNWIFEIFCLLACILAVAGEPPIAGVVLSFLLAKLAGQAQITPGGLGPVDVALTTSLVAIAAMTSVQAFAAVIVYRMIGFIGLTAVGWLIYFGAKLARPIFDTDPTRPCPATDDA
ncbi:lysylphosphatidylglycerol synthase transmembrane domain-containing protein [Corynebacterium anserum]|nr:YbhN family protein [Corynebacterium anserum]